MPMDEIYWNSIDFGSEDESVIHEPPKNYVDPWDLENYAYIREHLDSIDLDSDPSSSTDFAMETPSTSFHYAPAQMNQYAPVHRVDHYAPVQMGHYAPVQMGHYAAIDEIRAYDKKSKSRRRNLSTGGLYRDGFDSEFDENPYEVNLKDVHSHYVYDQKDRWNKVPLPSPGRHNSRDRSFSFSYGDYGTSQEIYSRLDEIYTRRADTILPIYDDVRSARRKPRNFGLSNYGHLKIDYSYSWNKLDKYICN